ncbi:MAG: NepR family anti-sigma factor [Methylocystis sp.]
MHIKIEGSMGNKNPENIVARAKADDDAFAGEGRYSPRPGPRRLETFAGWVMTRDELGDRRRGVGEARCGAKPAQRQRPVEFQDSIGKELRNLYDDVVSQPVPDRFLKLLNQLETNVLSSPATSSAPRKSE